MIQCPPLNWITLGRIKSDNNNRMIQLTEGTFVLLLSQILQNESILMCVLSGLQVNYSFWNLLIKSIALHPTFHCFYFFKFK